jgi:hypothetical protein
MIRFAALCAVLVAGCDAYDRDIGSAPYLCGAVEPRCPDDYSCRHDENTGEDVCVGGDSQTSGVQCKDDSAVEPNDALTDAVATGADPARTYERADLSICPPRDVDSFAVMLAAAGRIELQVVFDRGSALHAAILNSGGIPIATASLEDANRTLHADSAMLVAGAYYAQVTSTTGRANNYAITVRVH